MNITDPIRHIATTQPDTIALLRMRGDGITYRAFNTQIDRCAAHARAIGLKRGDIVGMRISWMDEGLGLIVALGLARAGIVTTELALPALHLTAVIPREHLQAPEGVRHIPLDWSWLAAEIVPLTEAEAAEDDSDQLFRIFSTSGTTGRSRYPAVTHRQMAARVAATRAPITDVPWHPTILCAVGVDGNFGMRIALATLGAGATLMVGEYYSEKMLELLEAQNVTAIFTSPANLQAIVNRIPEGVGPFACLKQVVVGGSQLPSPLWETASRRLCPDIVVTFGASETSVIAMGFFDEMADIPQAVGDVVPDVEVQAVDENDQPFPAGSLGILRFRTAGDSVGYFDDPEATRQTFRNGWFYSGDIGGVTPDGILCVAGRTSEFINNGGIKISPRLIEEILLKFPGVKEAAAFPVRSAYGLAEPWAAIVADTAIDSQTLSQHCLAALGAAAPKSYLQVQNLPRNPNGKVMNYVLVELAEKMIAQQSEATHSTPAPPVG